jgi:hypothetical protein
MSAQLYSIVTGKRLPDNFVVTDEQIVSNRVKQALKHFPPQLRGEAIAEGHRRLTWGNRSPIEAADSAIAWAQRRLLNPPPDDAA